jgi:hypothetical protein
MVVVSVPMMAIVIGYLRRTRTLFPARSLAAAGAGVACMALTLLALCHPTHVSALDFLMHISATATYWAPCWVISGCRCPTLKRPSSFRLHDIRAQSGFESCSGVYGYQQ